MTYCYSKKTQNDFEQSIEDLTIKLEGKGFGVLTKIDVKAVLKKKIDVDFYNYTILGACNPHFAHKALLLEDKIGVMLSCNVIVQQKSANNQVEVSAIDPVISMGAVKNEKIMELAEEVRSLLEEVIDSLN